MNKGVEILLERIKTNPEEFDGQGRDSKWENIVYRYADWLDEEDKEAFKNALKQMRQEKFTEEVMKELLAPEEEDSLGKSWYTKQTAMPLGGQTLGGSSGGSVIVNAGGKSIVFNSASPNGRVSPMMSTSNTSIFKKLFKKGSNP